jgi:hypothetical protein
VNEVKQKCHPRKLSPKRLATLKMSAAMVVSVLWFILSLSCVTVHFGFHAGEEHPLYRAVSGMPVSGQATYHTAILGGVSMWSSSLLLVRGRRSCTPMHWDWSGTNNIYRLFFTITALICCDGTSVYRNRQQIV